MKYTRINEHGVEVGVCCDTDMTLEVRHVRPTNYHRGWDERWCCNVCYKEIGTEE